MIDRFSLTEFSNALPCVGGQPLWTCLGLVNGEYCFLIPIQPGVVIYLRSSIDSTGVAAARAEDSIRCWLAADGKGTTLGSKAQKYVTRVNGWQTRLTVVLRKLWILGTRLKKCPRCKGQLHLRKFKTGDRAGRFTGMCPACNWWMDTYIDHGLEEILERKAQETRVGRHKRVSKPAQGAGA